MSKADNSIPGKLRLRLPATSANLGAGFDAAAVALDFALYVEAESNTEFSILASGRNADRCALLENNLIVDLYRRTLEANGRSVVPLTIHMKNEIPLGMGCGSSAAGRLAALAMANHFGALGWTGERMLAEASRLEGHPDNAAACWLGGFVVAGTEGNTVRVARVEPPPDWRALVVLPTAPLATSEARAVLPDTYSRDDVVSNLQAVGMLGLAFAQGRGDLLRLAMSDRIHQPYRAAICPMLPRLLPLAGTDGILGVALSGAGPGVLIILDGDLWISSASDRVQAAVADIDAPEIMVCRLENRGATAS